MGMFKRKSHSYQSTTQERIDFSKFEIIKSCKVGQLYVSKIKYYDFKNFEGMKIIISLSNPKLYFKFDPHFLETNDVLVRLRPDKGMFFMAKKIAEFIQKNI